MRAVGLFCTYQSHYSAFSSAASLPVLSSTVVAVAIGALWGKNIDWVYFSIFSLQLTRCSDYLARDCRCAACVFKD